MLDLNFIKYYALVQIIHHCKKFSCTLKGKFCVHFAVINVQSNPS
jgi:hypothetical protein